MVIDYILLALIVILTAFLGLRLGFLAGYERAKEDLKPAEPKLTYWLKRETIDERGRKKTAWQCSKCNGIGWPNMKYCPHCKAEKPGEADWKSILRPYMVEDKSKTARLDRSIP